MERSDTQRTIVDRIAVTATRGAAVLILGVCTAVASSRGDAAGTLSCGPQTTANAHVSEADTPTSPDSSSLPAACAKTAAPPRS